MKPSIFDKLVDARFQACKQTLGGKSREYARDDDKLHNFKRAAAMLSCTPEKALVGMLTKHMVSILDIVDDLDVGVVPSDAILSEKITDSINYMVLLESLVRERMIE